jgi:hypothetical protein
VWEKKLSHGNGEAEKFYRALQGAALIGMEATGIDLRAEPTVLSVPAVSKPRYYSVQLTDANTFNYGYIGSRAIGTEPVVDQSWAPPPAVQIK